MDILDSPYRTQKLMELPSNALSTPTTPNKYFFLHKLPSLAVTFDQTSATISKSCDSKVFLPFFKILLYLDFSSSD